MKLNLLFLSLCTAVSVLGASAHADAAHLEDIQKRGVLLVGTTGDYKPMSYLNPQSGQYEGFDTALSQLLAQSLHVSVRYVPTTWKSLTADTKNGIFFIRIGGGDCFFHRCADLRFHRGIYSFFGSIRFHAFQIGFDLRQCFHLPSSLFIPYNFIIFIRSWQE